MSIDARYLIHYEPQMYANDFPKEALDALNNHPDLSWETPVHIVAPFDYMGSGNRMDDRLVVEVSRADQVLVQYNNDEWRDITHKFGGDDE